MPEDFRHGYDRPGHHGVCRALAQHVRREAFGVLRAILAAAMRDGGAALYRAMGRRASEMDRGEMALRISAQSGKDLRRDVAPAEGSRRAYLLQSFRSLSEIENTASALISMSRTTHCLLPR